MVNVYGNNINQANQGYYPVQYPAMQYPQYPVNYYPQPAYYNVQQTYQFAPAAPAPNIAKTPNNDVFKISFSKK